MTSEGLGEMFAGDSADMCTSKFPLMLMGVRAEGLACADLGARNPIGVSRILESSVGIECYILQAILLHDPAWSSMIPHDPT